MLIPVEDYLGNIGLEDYTLIVSKSFELATGIEWWKIFIKHMYKTKNFLIHSEDHFLSY